MTVLVGMRNPHDPPAGPKARLGAPRLGVKTSENGGLTFLLCHAKYLVMETNWAVEHLQTIRTLMERSALYRRALAPTMVFAGVLGTVAGAAGLLLLRLESPTVFTGYWLGVGVVALAGALLLVRRQALKDREPFWSPPTRRVAQAILPPLLAGLVAGVPFLGWVEDAEPTILLPLIWIVLYGCALHAAGFFTPRGLRLFGWVFVLGGCAILLAILVLEPDLTLAVCHALMGAFFGLLHLAYGAYLYFTERRKQAA
jgi:hypothetical protein